MKKGVMFWSLVLGMGCYGPNPEEMARNENAVEGVLCEIFFAQEEFRKEVIKDRDRDGRGEYGFLLDLGVHEARKKGSDCDEAPATLVLLGWILTPSPGGDRHVLVCEEHNVEIYMQDHRGFNLWNGEARDGALIEFQERSYLVSAVPRDIEEIGRYWYVMDQTGTGMKFPLADFHGKKNSASSGAVPVKKDEAGVFSIDVRKAAREGWRTVSFERSGG
ncbi:MAG: hypothetical protein ACYTHN_22590 [Planctomycetota bacterium]